MKAVTVKELKTELIDRSHSELMELCLRLSRFKKENKELLTYLLFESSNEHGYINSVKIAFFNELYLYCQAKNINYNETRDLMLKNGWINQMHTEVPGTDGQLGFGGACFPKDTSALLADMKREGVAHKILNSVVEENNEIRNISKHRSKFR